MQPSLQTFSELQLSLPKKSDTLRDFPLALAAETLKPSSFGVVVGVVIASIDDVAYLKSGCGLALGG